MLSINMLSINMLSINMLSINMLSIGAVDRGEEVGEGPVRACGVAGCVEVHQEAADDGEHDGGKLGSAEAAHASLGRGEPVGGRGAPEAGPEWFSRGVVQPAEHAQEGLALGP